MEIITRKILLIILLAAFFWAHGLVSSHASITFRLDVYMNGVGWYSLNPAGDDYLWGTDVEVTITGDDVSNSSSTRYFYDGVAGDGTGSYTGDAAVFHVTMGSDIIEDVEWRAEYKVIFDASGITGDTGLNTVVTVGGVAKVKADLPFSAWYSYGAMVTFTYSSPVAAAYDLSTTTATMTDVSGHLYSIGVTNTHTVTGPATIMGTYGPHPSDSSPTTVTCTTTATSPLIYTPPTGSLLPSGLLPSGVSDTLGASPYGIPNWLIVLGLFILIVIVIARRRKKQKRRRGRKV